MGHSNRGPLSCTLSFKSDPIPFKANFSDLSSSFCSKSPQIPTIPHHPSSPQRHFLPCTFFSICSFISDFDNPDFNNYNKSFSWMTGILPRSLENGKERKHAHSYFFYSYFIYMMKKVKIIKVLHCPSKILFTLFHRENLTVKEPTYYTLIQNGKLETHKQTNKSTFLRKGIQIVYTITVVSHVKTSLIPYRRN